VENYNTAVTVVDKARVLTSTESMISPLKSFYWNSSQIAPLSYLLMHDISYIPVCGKLNWSVGSSSVPGLWVLPKISKDSTANFPASEH
jgi:hypothetical protein